MIYYFCKFIYIYISKKNVDECFVKIKYTDYDKLTAVKTHFFLFLLEVGQQCCDQV